MGFPQGIAFRNTANFVTDVSPNDHDISTTADYPFTTVQGNTAGWEDALNSTTDGNSGNDARIAGHAFNQFNSQARFRIDLPATGNYNIRCAGGRTDGSSGDTQIDLYDNLTLLQTLCSNLTPNTNLYDAANTGYSATNWPGSNSPASATFASTICRFTMPGSLGFLSVSYVYIESAGGAAAPPWFPMQQNADNLTLQIKMIRSGP